MNQKDFTINNRDDEFEYEGQKVRRSDQSQITFHPLAVYENPAIKPPPPAPPEDTRGRLRRENLKLQNENAFLWTVNYAILAVLAGIIGVCAYWHQGWNEEEIKFVFAVIALILSGRLNYKSHISGESNDTTRK